MQSFLVLLSIYLCEEIIEYKHIINSRSLIKIFDLIRLANRVLIFNMCKLLIMKF